MERKGEGEEQGEEGKGDRTKLLPPLMVKLPFHYIYD
jgi:hypothetical protein